MPLRPMSIPAFGSTLAWVETAHTTTVIHMALMATAPTSWARARRRSAGLGAVTGAAASSTGSEITDSESVDGRRRNAAPAWAGIVTGTTIKGNRVMKTGTSSTRPCMKSPP